MSGECEREHETKDATEPPPNNTSPYYRYFGDTAIHGAVLSGDIQHLRNLLQHGLRCKVQSD